MWEVRLTRRGWLAGAAAAVGFGHAARCQGQGSGRVPTSGQAGPGLEHLDGVMLAMVRKHGFPGASLSLAKGGRLVFARGYGYADTATRTPVKPEMLFGIGSVSKTITAAAVLKLVEAGRLGLDDRAFAILGDLKPLPGARVDPRIRDITVRMLLNHTSGIELTSHPGEAARAFKVAKDAATPDQLIRFGLGRPLEYKPGTKAQYSNNGYLILGQIVAHLSGQPYEDHVLRHVFAPMGIRRAAYGTRAESYPADWVHRYDRQGRELEPLRPVAAGAAGIWVTSSVELVRFLTALDGTRAPRFLSRATMKEMLAPAPPPVKPRKDGSHFGLGWDNVEPSPRGPSYSKNGGLPGYRAFIGHMPGNIAWAFVATDATGDKGENADTAAAIRQAIGRTSTWPTVNFFNRTL